ncbi:hypothetical protein RI367_006470 [Sorochytrium milnesiophthora]
MGGLLSQCGGSNSMADQASRSQSQLLNSRALQGRDVNDEPREMAITKPTDVEQGIHIEYDEQSGVISGVPRQWKDAFPSGLKVETTSTRGLPRNLTPTPGPSDSSLPLPANGEPRSNAAVISKPFNVQHNDVMLKRSGKNEFTTVTVPKPQSPTASTASGRPRHHRQRSGDSATSVPSSSYSEMTAPPISPKHQQSHRRQRSTDSAHSSSRQQQTGEYMPPLSVGPRTTSKQPQPLPLQQSSSLQMQLPRRNSNQPLSGYKDERKKSSASSVSSPLLAIPKSGSSSTLRPQPPSSSTIDPSARQSKYSTDASPRNGNTQEYYRMNGAQAPSSPIGNSNNNNNNFLPPIPVSLPMALPYAVDTSSSAAVGGQSARQSIVSSVSPAKGGSSDTAANQSFQRRRSSARRSKMISIHPYFKNAIFQHFEAQAASTGSDVGSTVLADTFVDGSTANGDSGGINTLRRDMISIHPAFQRLIEESEEYSKFKQTLQRRSSSPQDGGSGDPVVPDQGISPPRTRYTTMSSTKTADSMRDVNDTLDLYSSMPAGNSAPEVTPETIDAILEPFVEDQDPRSLYTDVVPVAEGASGDVHFAEDAMVHAKVAIKIIPKRDDRSTLKLQTIRNEIALMQRSRHRNIVECIGVYLTEAEIWVVMECMDGGSLADVIMESPLPDAVAAYVAHEILQGLEYLHSQHRIHRDIRSDVILLTQRGEVKLADFGYCLELPNAQATVTDVVGTPYWMAPEVVAGARYNCKADVWSFGVVLMEMLEQEYPYADLEVDAVLAAIRTQGVPQLRGRPVSTDLEGQEDDGQTVWVSTQCLEVWTHATQMNPQDRWTAAQLLKTEWIAGAVATGQRASAVQQLQQLIADSAASA